MSHLETDAEGRQKRKNQDHREVAGRENHGRRAIHSRFENESSRWEILVPDAEQRQRYSQVAHGQCSERSRFENDLKAVDTAIRVYYEMETPIGDHDQRPADAPVTGPR